MKFNLGDHVRWDSTVHGVKIRKKGKIAYIIDSFSSLIEVLESGDLTTKFGKNINIIYNRLGDFRPYESYLVIVGKKDGKIPTLHWPDVDTLRKVRKRKSNHKTIKIDED